CQRSATPGLRLIIRPPGLWTSSGRPASRRIIFGIVRNGQAFAENSAQSLCDGGSAETRLTPHIGPTTEAYPGPRPRPQTQQRCFQSASRQLRPAAALNLGTPLIQETNQGTT